MELSQQLDTLTQRTEPLIALAPQWLGAGDYLAAGELIDRASGIADASGDAKAMLAVNRIAAQVQHFNGRHAVARRLARLVLDHPIAQIPLTYNTMPVDRRVSMRVVLARAAWMQGLADQAAELSEQAIDYARRDSAFALSQALVLGAIPVALWRGDDATADKLTTLLAEGGGRYSLAFWQSWATAFRSLLQNRAGMTSVSPRLAGGLQLDTFTTFSVDFLVPATILRADTGAAGWCTPEIHRAQGEWLLAHGAPGAAAAAETLFQRALSVARDQEALAWELRAAMSLARLWQRRGRLDDGRTLLSSVLQRFSEGHATADVREAAALVAGMAPSGELVSPAKPRRAASDGRRSGRP